MRSPNGVIYSKQLFSRFSLERDVHPRMLSTLARKLEQYRDNLLVWRQQDMVALAVVKKFQVELRAHEAELERWNMERLRVDSVFNEQHDILVRGLNAEIKRTQEATDEAKSRLEESLEVERQTTQAHKEQEEISRKIQTSLTKTMGQLDEQQDQLDRQRQLASLWEMKSQLNPGHADALKRIDEIKREKQLIDAEKQSVELGIASLQDEISRQQTYTMRLEDFVQRCVVGSTRLPPNSARRQEASKLLREANRIRTSMNF
jgi:chromosome segregation ATPase